MGKNAETGDCPGSCDRALFPSAVTDSYKKGESTDSPTRKENHPRGRDESQAVTAAGRGKDRISP